MPENFYPCFNCWVHNTFNSICLGLLNLVVDRVATFGSTGLSRSNVDVNRRMLFCRIVNRHL